MDHIFKNIEKKTGVNMKDVLELANSLQNANFNDEATVRKVIKRVAQLANRPVPRELENKIVNAIVNGKENMDFNTIANMLDNKKK